MKVKGNHKWNNLRTRTKEFITPVREFNQEEGQTELKPGSTFIQTIHFSADKGIKARTDSQVCNVHCIYCFL